MFKDTPEGQTHCDLVADAKQRALDLYKPPFKYDQFHEKIYDTEDNYFSYVSYTAGELIAEALNEYYDKRKEQ